MALYANTKIGFNHLCERVHLIGTQNAAHADLPHGIVAKNDLTDVVLVHLRYHVGQGSGRKLKSRNSPRCPVTQFLVVHRPHHWNPLQLLRYLEQNRLAGIERYDGFGQREHRRGGRHCKRMHADATFRDQDRQFLIGREFQSKGRAHCPDRDAPHPYHKRSIRVLRHFEIGGAAEKRYRSFRPAEVRRNPSITP